MAPVEQVAVPEQGARLRSGTVRQSEVEIVLIGSDDQVCSRQDETLHDLLDPSPSHQARDDRLARGLINLVVVAADPNQQRNTGRPRNH
jgi:hypothetical protein